MGIFRILMAWFFHFPYQYMELYSLPEVFMTLPSCDGVSKIVLDLDDSLALNN